LPQNPTKAQKVNNLVRVGWWATTATRQFLAKPIN